MQAYGPACTQVAVVNVANAMGNLAADTEIRLGFRAGGGVGALVRLCAGGWGEVQPCCSLAALALGCVHVGVCVCARRETLPGVRAWCRHVYASLDKRAPPSQQERTACRLVWTYGGADVVLMADACVQNRRSDSFSGCCALPVAFQGRALRPSAAFMEVGLKGTSRCGQACLVAAMASLW